MTTKTNVQFENKGAGLAATVEKVGSRWVSRYFDTDADAEFLPGGHRCKTHAQAVAKAREFVFGDGDDVDPDFTSSTCLHW